MLELAEDEQEYFISKMKERAFDGKTPAQGKPTITVIMGAQGSGKSHLATKIKNSVVISSDAVVAEYCRQLGIDPREDFYDKEIGMFATRVDNEILKEAVKKGYNITYDTPSIKNSEMVLEKLTDRGYHPDIKIILTDEFTSALNVVERKLDFDERYTCYRRNRLDGAEYPYGNVFGVAPQTSLDTSFCLNRFICRKLNENTNIEIYEYGKDKPSFKTGDDFGKFIDDMKLPSLKKQRQRCNMLKKRAEKSGNADYVMQLNRLRKDMDGY